MSDLKKYIDERKKRDKTFAKGYEESYEQFKVGVMLREAREASGLTQDELARRLKTKKTAISRIENHAEDIKLSTLERFAAALGKTLNISISSGSVGKVAETQADYKSGRVINRKATGSHQRYSNKGISREYASQVADFIDKYRPALKALAQISEHKKFKSALKKVNKDHGKTLQKLGK